MELNKKKLFCLVGILLCICAAIFCGVWYYLCNYNLKIWYGLQDEKTQQEAHTQFERYIKLSDEMPDYSLRRLEISKKQTDLLDDLTEKTALELIEIQLQYSALSKEYDNLGLMWNSIATQREGCRSGIEQLGFRGDATLDQIKEVLNKA